mmetsp:Transcript_112912/g.324529  ORF Transcript_112912/g.324529 Transcript_112912/m.324529 type:complete len:265 (+) Transcript_112912:428-1222(+)
MATPSIEAMLFSRSIEEIHSPPDLMTSFERSVMTIAPSLSTNAMSPVINQPLWNLSAASMLKYSVVTHGPRTSSSPGEPAGTSLSKSSGSAMRTSTPGKGMPAFTQLPNSSSAPFVVSVYFATRRPMEPKGFVSVMPQPWRNSTPSWSRYHLIISGGGADPPHVSIFKANAFFTFRTPCFMMAPRMPCHTVGTPVLMCTLHSTIELKSESGSMNLPVRMVRAPSVSTLKGTPQLSTWNIGTKGSTQWAPESPKASAPTEVSVWR